MNGLILCVAMICGQPVEDCRDGICFPEPAPQIQKKQYEWYRYSDIQQLLYKDGKIVGQWYIPEHAYYPWDGTKNLASCKPPIDPPGREIGQLEAWQKNGISARHDREQLSYGGKVIQPHRLHEAFEGKLEDDSGKGHLIIVARDQKVRDKVFVDWQKLPTEFTARYSVWMAPPDHFSMQDRFKGKPRFFTEGDPTIILEDKDGVVLFRRPRAEQRYASSDMQDLLKSDPDYNPELDPGLPTKAQSLLSALLTTKGYIVISCVVLTLILVLVRLVRKKK